MSASLMATRRAASAVKLRASPTLSSSSRQWVRYASNSPSQIPRRRGGKFLAFAAIFGTAAAGAYYWPSIQAQFTPESEPVVPKAAVEFEKPRKVAKTAEEHRELLSSQHLQVKSSWEHPGVYLWGSNTGKVIDPTSSEKYVKLPRRLGFFNDQLLRDMKLTKEFGAAVTEKGDLVQWGLGFSANATPTTTLQGKDLVKIEVSTDRIIALSKSGSVYSIPVSRDDQLGGSKSQQNDSWSLWSGGKESISFRDITPPLKSGERVKDIASGLEHCLMATSKGRVFAAASSATAFPSKGQMGVPGLTWETRPKGPYDSAHEITALKGFEITQVATGDYHSVVLDKLGRVFAFGDNTAGQLGFEPDVVVPSFDAPTIVDTGKLYRGTGLSPTVTKIAAGGINTFFTVDAVASGQPSPTRGVAPAKRIPQTTTDLWAAGQGVYGSLGTGRWTHVSVGPVKVKALSSLSEFDETNNRLMPIKLKSLSIGSTHCAAVMDNVTETTIANRSTDNETNWGADILFWGGNEHYQLGTGKRNNLNVPSYIGPLDGGEADSLKGRKGEMHRLCLTPRQTARLGEGGKGRKVTLEQKVECGRYVTGVYSAV